MRGLAQQINNFDYFYEMSDDQRTWEKGNKEKQSIILQLEQLTNSELIALKKFIQIHEQKINRCFGAFFQDLKETTTKAKTYLSEIMQNAWSLVRSKIFGTIKEALRYAWSRYKLLKQLRKGVAYFTFKKQNGEIREAMGTLRKGNFSYQFKNTNPKDKVSQVIYYDLQKRAWRSFQLQSLITIQ